MIVFVAGTSDVVRAQRMPLPEQLDAYRTLVFRGEDRLVLSWKLLLASIPPFAFAAGRWRDTVFRVCSVGAPIATSVAFATLFVESGYYWSEWCFALAGAFLLGAVAACLSLGRVPIANDVARWLARLGAVVGTGLAVLLGVGIGSMGSCEPECDGSSVVVVLGIGFAAAVFLLPSLAVLGRPWARWVVAVAIVLGAAGAVVGAIAG